MIDIVKSFFNYNANEPMIFTHGHFWIFFFVVMILYSVVEKHIRLRNILLMIGSLFFYYKSSGFYFVLIIISIVHDYFFAQWLFKLKENIHKNIMMVWIVIFNLGMLFYFKYAYFFTDSINSLLGTDFKAVNILSLFSNQVVGTEYDVFQILLPVGISFYTFQSLSYAIDIYRGTLKPVNNIFDYAFFVSFFPQLVAGPIVRASEFIPQIYSRFNVTNEEFSKAIFLIVFGLFKKMVISDYISVNFVDRVFDSPQSFTGFENLMAIYGYTIQIYCDFSGYTDIAIGIALLMGFRLNINFNRPYQAIDITDFWRRWHISLSTWLKDYLYISLGGNRKGAIRTYFNLFITMVLGGFWHGAHLKYIIWGALHGLMLIIHKLWLTLGITTKTGLFSKSISWFITFHAVVFCWIFFRVAEVDYVWIMLNQIFSNFGLDLVVTISLAYWKVFLILALGYAIHLLPKSIVTDRQAAFEKMPMPIKAVAIVLVILVIYQFKTADLQPFIYFQF